MLLLVLLLLVVVGGVGQAQKSSLTFVIFMRRGKS